MKKVKKLNMHESIKINSSIEGMGDYLITATRVPGGILYTLREKDIGSQCLTTTFVSYNFKGE